MSFYDKKNDSFEINNDKQRDEDEKNEAWMFS